MNSADKIDKKIIGDRLRETRKSRHLTQKEVCSELGIPQSNLSLYETGENTPPLLLLLAYAEKYGVSVDYLLGVSSLPQKNDIMDLIAENKVSVNITEESVSLDIIDEELRKSILEKSKKDS